MHEPKLLAAVEAILFTMGESVELEKIAKALEKTEEETREILIALKQKYEAEESGLDVVELENCFRICTKKSTYDYLIKIAAQPKKQVLTDALLETLSIIAYKQPITRSEIETIRGVKCEHVINKLLEYQLIMEAGRLESIGRPIIFATTEEFLRKFGLTSIKELPELDFDKMAEFQAQAEQEIEPETKKDSDIETTNEEYKENVPNNQTISSGTEKLENEAEE